ncbi:MAG: hypothetical protein AB1757_10585 [Acidobacteriota bacterium]
MRRLIQVLGAGLLIQFLALSLFAQQDKLIGKWEGKIQSPQGERPTTATFKKEGDIVVGTMPGMRGGSELKLKDIKVDGNKVTAKADVETPQGAFTINYSFTLEGDAMTGQGNVDFGGQSIAFDISLKRAKDESQPTQPAQSAQPQPPAGQNPQRRSSVPQPQQKQSIDYFVGQWSYKYIGRESAFGPAPRECTLTFTKRADGKTLDGKTECKGDSASFKHSAVLVYDEATKQMTLTEKLSTGITINSKGDWSSPISIKFTIDPVKSKGQSLQLRRTISIVSAHSFAIAEELAEDGGQFVRLGSAVLSKAGATQ